MEPEGAIRPLSVVVRDRARRRMQIRRGRPLVFRRRAPVMDQRTHRNSSPRLANACSNFRSTRQGRLPPAFGRPTQLSALAAGDSKVYRLVVQHTEHQAVAVGAVAARTYALVTMVGRT
jgi:hypothetical protein